MTTRPAPRIGVAVPQVAVGVAPASRLNRFCAEAESAGFDGIWLQEDILSERGTLEPLALLGFVAAATESASLGVATLLTPMHNPVHLAKSLATIDLLSGG